MRKISGLLAAIAVGGSLFAATPANAVGVNTCVVAAGVYVGPGGVYIEYFELKSVGECV